MNKKIKKQTWNTKYCLAKYCDSGFEVGASYNTLKEAQKVLKSNHSWATDMEFIVKSETVLSRMPERNK